MIRPFSVMILPKGDTVLTEVAIGLAGLEVMMWNYLLCGGIHPAILFYNVRHPDPHCLIYLNNYQNCNKIAPFKIRYASDKCIRGRGNAPLYIYNCCSTQNQFKRVFFYFGTGYGFLGKIFQRQIVVQPALSGTVNTRSAISKLKKTSIV